MELITEYNNVNEVAFVEEEDTRVYVLDIEEESEKSDPDQLELVIIRFKREASSIILKSKKDPVDKSWTLSFDGSKCKQGSGAGVELQSPNGRRYHASYRLQFPNTCNIAEYEALIHDLKLALFKKIKHLQVVGDSEVVVKQIQGIYICKNPRLHTYKTRAWDLIDCFEAFNIKTVPRKILHFADLP